MVPNGSMNGSVEPQLNPGNRVHSGFHPNEDGHDQMGVTLADWLTAHPNFDAKDDGTGSDDDIDEDALTVDPKCSVVPGPTEVGCKPIARDWAIDETRALLRETGFYALAAMAGAWLIWFGVIGRYRQTKR